MAQFQQVFNNSKLNIRDEWETPNWMIIPLNTVFNFTIDAAATEENRKFRRFWSIEDNGLEQSWKGEIVFANPPWTNGAYGKWIKKAKEELYDNGVASVLILPFKPEVRSFKYVWECANHLIIPRKRTRFRPPEGVELKNNAPTFASCVVVFGYKILSRYDLIRLDRVGYVLNLYAGLFRK